MVLRFGRGGRWFRPSQPCFVSARKRTRVVRKKIFSWKRVAPHGRGTWYTGLSGEEQVDQEDLDNYAGDDNDGDIGDLTLTIRIIMMKMRIIKMMLMMMIVVKPAEWHTTVPSVLPATSSREGAGTHTRAG